MIMKHIGIWALFTVSTLFGAWLSHVIFNVGIDLRALFSFSLGMAFMQGFNYEMDSKGKDQ
jgi:hypothetical protein